MAGRFGDGEIATLLNRLRLPQRTGAGNIYRRFIERSTAPAERKRPPTASGLEERSFVFRELMM